MCIYRLNLFAPQNEENKIKLLQAAQISPEITFKMYNFSNRHFKTIYKH